MKYPLFKPLALIIIVITAASFTIDRNKKPGNDATIDRKVDSLLKMMTLKEKIGQMTQFTSDYDVTGPTMRQGYKDDIKAGRVGSVFNALGAKYTRELQKLAVENTRLHIPLIFGYDVIHGYKTIFPISLGETASWDTTAIEQSARIAATEASAEGLHWTFAPMVDIARDPRWGRIMEGAGEDPFLGSQVAKARVNGFQNHQLGATNTVVACIKHYAAYGAAQAGRDYNTTDMSERTLREVYLPPYHVIPFSTYDNGGDIVETSFMIEGLLTARNYFNQNTPDEQQIVQKITSLWEAVEWDWYTRNNSGFIYWHWSPNYAWQMNMPIYGYMEIVGSAGLELTTTISIHSDFSGKSCCFSTSEASANC